MTADEPVVPATEQIAPPAEPAVAAPAQTEPERRRVLATRLFFGAAGALALAAILPWVSAIGIISVHLSGGGVVYVLAFAAVYGVIGYRVSQQRASKGLLVATWVLDVWMVVNVIAIFAAFDDQHDIISVSPASGVFVASAGVIAAIVATVQLSRSRT